MTDITSEPKLPDRPAVLLLTAAAISTLSFFFRDLVPGKPIVMELIVGYFPLLLGCVAMALCVLALNKAAHKRLVILYAVILAPFAFSYPAWLIILWILYASGRYTGPMP